MKKILIIDDNPLNNEFYIKPLRQEYEVKVAMHLFSAERLLRQRKFDLIIIDVMMPTQHLQTSNEMTTGFVFYKEKIKPAALDAKILFWTRLSEDCFKQYFVHETDTIFYVHKESLETHLLNKVKSIFA